jgi:hypothetical protein
VVKVAVAQEGALIADTAGMVQETVTIERADLTDDVSRALIDSLNAELSVTALSSLRTKTKRRLAAAHCGSSTMTRPSSSECMSLPQRAERVWGGAWWRRWRPRPGHWAFSGSFSRQAFGRLLRSRSIERVASTQSRYSGNTAALRKPAYALARISEAESMHGSCPTETNQTRRLMKGQHQLCGRSSLFWPVRQGRHTTSTRARRLRRRPGRFAR